MKRAESEFLSPQTRVSTVDLRIGWPSENAELVIDVTTAHRLALDDTFSRNVANSGADSLKVDASRVPASHSQERTWMAFIITALGDLYSQRVLVLGVTDGSLPVYLAQQGADVVCVDELLERLHLVERRAVSSGLQNGLRMKQCSFADFTDSHDEGFDSVISLTQRTSDDVHQIIELVLPMLCIGATVTFATPSGTIGKTFLRPLRQIFGSCEFRRFRGGCPQDVVTLHNYGRNTPPARDRVRFHWWGARSPLRAHR